MTRKNYIAIAKIFAEERPGENWDRNKMEQWHVLLNRIVAYLGADNPNFDRSKFLRAANKGGVNAGGTPSRSTDAGKAP